MIIFPQKNIKVAVFTHIEKCAGMSLCKLLKINKKSHPYDLRYRHRTLSEDLYYLKVKMKQNLNLNKILFFTCFRNPWDRILSFYFYIRKINLDESSIYWSPYHEICKKGNFHDFIKYAKDNHHLIPTFRTYKSRLVYDNKIITDFIMNFHTLNQDIKCLKHIFDIKEKMPKINTSKHKSYKFYYNSASEEIIRYMFREDIEEFKFSFDKTDQMIKPPVNFNKIKNLSGKNFKIL